MLCGVCKKNKAIYDEYYGWLPCKECTERQAKKTKPGSSIPEFAGDDIREGRNMHADDIEQPHYRGHLNKKWLDLYGKKAALRRGFTKEEIKNAKYVYNGLTKYYREDG